MEKLEWCGYSMMKKFDDLFNCFDNTDMWKTDRWTSCHGIDRAYAEPLHGKNEQIYLAVKTNSDHTA